MKMFQVKIGIRNMVMPGARRHSVVVIMLIAEAMVPTPVIPTPTIQRFDPTPGLWMASASGMYIVQPKSAAPPGVRNPARTISPPNSVIQNPKALSRGNATSGAPICSGRMALAKPQTIGVPNSSSMSVPWMVNIWLNCSLDRYCIPGWKSSTRMNSAISPAAKKNRNDITMYMIPSFLWSVVVSMSQAWLPLADRPPWAVGRSAWATAWAAA